VSPVNDQDQTLIIPAQRLATHDEAVAPAEVTDTAVSGDDDTVVTPKEDLVPPPVERTSAWDEQPTPRGVMPVGGAPFGRDKALGTLAWILAMVTTAALALIRLNWASMRVNELAVWGFTQTPAAHLFDMLPDVNTADTPYLLGMKGWASLVGRSDFALRVPSVLAMVGAVGLIAVLANRVGGPRVGVLAGMTAAVLPVTSRYAQEVGPQALTMLGATLSTLALVAFLDRPKAWQFTGYAAALLLTGLANVTGLLVVVAHLLVLLVMKRRLLLPWLGAVVIGALPVAGLFFAPGLKPWDVTDGPAAEPSVVQLGQDAFGAVVIAGVVIGFGLLAMSMRKPAVVYSGWAILPLLLLYPVARYSTFPPEQLAIVAVPGWIGLAALGLSRVLIMRALTAVVVLAALAIPAQIDIRQADGHGQATHELADVLYTQVKSGDAIVYGPASGDGPAGRDIVDRYLSVSHRPTDILAKVPPRVNGRLRAVECPDVDACLGKTQRIWLVRVGVLDSPLTGLEAGKDGALRVRYTQAQTWSLTGLTLALYTLKSNA
jgi:mannosyltransferase